MCQDRCETRACSGYVRTNRIIIVCPGSRCPWSASFGGCRRWTLAMTNSPICIVIALLFTIALAQGTKAQPGASLTGTVADENGAVVVFGANCGNASRLQRARDVGLQI